MLQWAVDTFKAGGAMCVSYDPVSLDDAFGKVMINNLKVGKPVAVANLR